MINMMFQYRIVTLLAFTLTAWSQLATAQESPVQVVKVERGMNCGNPNSIQVSFLNRSERPISLKTCLERGDRPTDNLKKRWSCGFNSKVKPREIAKSYTCDATGQYNFWWGPPGYASSYPPPNAESGQAWSAEIKCGDEKIAFSIDAAHEKYTRVRTSTGVKVTVKNRKHTEGSNDQWEVLLSSITPMICDKLDPDSSYQRKVVEKVLDAYKQSYLYFCQTEILNAESCEQKIKTINDGGAVIRG